MLKKALHPSVVFDLDGTLLNSQHQVSEFNLEMINKVRAKGFEVFLASGRPWYFISQTWYTVGCTTPIISCNGALVYDVVNQKTLFVNPIEKTLSEMIYKKLKRLKLNFLVYTDQEMYYWISQTPSQRISWLESEIANSRPEARFNLKAIDDKFDIKAFDIVKFLILDNETPIKNIEALKADFADKNVYFINSQPGIWDIMPQGSDKGEGLKFLQKSRLLDLEKTIAFGDQDNDIPMFKVVKTAVAMGQASNHVQANANYATETNDENGVGQFLERWLEKYY
ncbi:HAD family hydrolase [Candidatus Mycoplasma pogonae]